MKRLVESVSGVIASCAIDVYIREKISSFSDEESEVDLCESNRFSSVCFITIYITITLGFCDHFFIVFVCDCPLLPPPPHLSFVSGSKKTYA